MIEVMMEKRQQEPSAKEISGGDRIEFAGQVLPENPAGVRKKDKNEEWLNLPDRI